MTLTHEATCTDDGLVIPLRLDRAAGTCASCERERGRWLVLADGGPGWICELCTAELGWELRRLTFKERFNLRLLALAAGVSPLEMWHELGR